MFEKLTGKKVPSKVCHERFPFGAFTNMDRSSSRTKTRARVHSGVPRTRTFLSDKSIKRTKTRTTGNLSLGIGLVF